jgi:hypothetical protein
MCESHARVRAIASELSSTMKVEGRGNAIHNAIASLHVLINSSQTNLIQPTTLLKALLVAKTSNKFCNFRYNFIFVNKDSSISG